MNLPTNSGVVNTRRRAPNDAGRFARVPLEHLPWLAQSSPQWAVWLYLRSRGERSTASTSTIAEACGLTPRAVWKALRRLVECGMAQEDGTSDHGHQVYRTDMPVPDVDNDGSVCGHRDPEKVPFVELKVPFVDCASSMDSGRGREVEEKDLEEKQEENAKTGADAPERPDMTSSKWRDLQAEAEALWSATDAGDGTDAVATTQPSASATLTPSAQGGTPSAEAQTAPETAPPPPPPFALEPPGPPAKAKRGRAAKPTCPPEALETLRKAWCIYVGGRASLIPAGFAEACADLLEQTKGDQDLVIRAFKGFSKSDWHMGRDERSNGHKYAHPRYVARDLDSFLAMADAEDAAAGSAAEREFHAAEADLDRLLSQHGAALELELEDLPAATSERAKTRFGPHGGMDREGVLRGVRVAYRLERDGEISGSGTRFSRYTQRCAIEAVLAKMAMDQWGKGSLHHRAQVERLRSLVRATEAVAALHHDEMERRRAEEILLDRRPDWWTPEDDACLDAPRVAVDTALTQDASKEPANA